MTIGTLMRQPTGYVPMAMSLAAFAMIVWFVAVHGVVHQADEGTEAHLWQLLMVGQLPVLLFFAFKWLPRAPRQTFYVLALQAGAALASIAPVLFLHL